MRPSRGPIAPQPIQTIAPLAHSMSSIVGLKSATRAGSSTRLSTDHGTARPSSCTRTSSRRRGPLRTRADSVPCGRETAEGRRIDGRDLVAQLRERAPLELDATLRRHTIPRRRRPAPARRARARRRLRAREGAVQPRPPTGDTRVATSSVTKGPARMREATQQRRHRLSRRP